MRAYTLAEVDAISAEPSAAYKPLPAFAAATGLRPEKWSALERRDVDRRAGVVSVQRTVSGGAVEELAKTDASRRQVPLSARALAALDQLPARLNTPLLFPSPDGRVLNLDNFRRREWGPAIEAAGIAKPARIYDLRSTFISHALTAPGRPDSERLSIYEVATVAGTSVRMIERHHGTLLDGAGASIARRLSAIEAEVARPDDAADARP